MVAQRLNWIGHSVGDYVIKAALGEGSFSWVFRALHADGRTSRAFKVPKPAAAVHEERLSNCVPTQALIRREKKIVSVTPDTDQLLCLQAKKLMLINDPGLVSVDAMAQEKSGCFYRMPVIPGRTLREYLSSGPVPVDVLLDIAITMDRLGKDSALEYHGDLKPENIMITPSGVVMLDPGYLGPLKLAVQGAGEATDTNCMVTTPLYYPRLDGDDLFAFGLMIWEVACRQQLLAKESTSRDYDRSVVSDEMMDQVEKIEFENNYYLSSILSAQPPSSLRPGIPHEIEEFVTNAVRISWNEQGKLEYCRGYQSFAEIASALASLLSKKIRYI